MQRIVNEINKMSGSYHPHGIFQDWVEMSAISISNQCCFDEELEKRYMGIARKYTNDQLTNLSSLTGVLIELLQNEISDYLGTIYMKLNAGSSKTGQFFTPFHICELMAKTALTGYDGKEMVINEPSVGGGGNILALAKVLKEKGYNYQDLLKVVGQDLDYKCVFMSYVQFSLIGLNAKLIQGNTLSKENNMTLYTPVYVLKGGF